MPTRTFTAEVSTLRLQLLTYIQQFDTFAILDSNGYNSEQTIAGRYNTYDLIAGVGVAKSFTADAGTAFIDFEQWRKGSPGWTFGYFGYNLKNETEKLTSSNFDGLGMEDLFFFQPEIRLTLRGASLEIECDDPEEMWKQICVQKIFEAEGIKPLLFYSRMPKEAYLNSVEAIRSEILEGNVYEVNLCQEFYSESKDFDPFSAWLKMGQTTPQPFSAFIRMGEKFILCASMERFLKKDGDKLISQPIKGTIGRGKSESDDKVLRGKLLSDEKERSENVMIVDLVRNDLSKSSVPGSVQVEELCGVYRFPFVHQMISTVISQKLQDVSEVAAIKNAFPMGSMTGAPKPAAMKLIEQYEHSNRGVYSGAIGYFDSSDNFDLNVVIRTLGFYRRSGYLSIHAGSAITYDSIPESEYNECLLKIKGLLSAVGGSISDA